jgi:hypothetical protein
MANLLLPVPWWLMGIIAIIGVGMAVSGNARQNKAIRNGGAALMLLTVVLLLVNHFVETDVEKCDRQTREVMRAVQDSDWPKLQSLSDPKVSLTTVLGPLFNNRDDLIKAAQRAVADYQLKSITVASLDTKQDPTGITCNVDVFTVQGSSMDRPVPSSWQFDWEPRSGGWTLVRITCLKIGDQDAGSIKQLSRRGF